MYQQQRKLQLYNCIPCNRKMPIHDKASHENSKKHKIKEAECYSDSYTTLCVKSKWIVYLSSFKTAMIIVCYIAYNLRYPLSMVDPTKGPLVDFDKGCLSLFMFIEVLNCLSSFILLENGKDRKYQMFPITYPQKLMNII